MTPTCLVLPAGWKRCYDEIVGCEYYFNPNSGEAGLDSPPCQQFFDGEKDLAINELLGHALHPSIHAVSRYEKGHIRHPESVAVAVNLRLPNMIEGQEASFAVGMAGRVDRVVYGILVEVMRGTEVVHSDGWFLDEDYFEERMPPLQFAQHTIRVSIIDIFPDLSVDDCILSQRLQVPCS